MEREPAQPGADLLGLHPPEVVERNVALALQPRLGVPVGLAVADEIERVRQRRGRRRAGHGHSPGPSDAAG